MTCCYMGQSHHHYDVQTLLGFDPAGFLVFLNTICDNPLRLCRNEYLPTKYASNEANSHGRRRSRIALPTAV